MKMSKYCFLCLSDEGVFLNITPYNYKSLCGEVESYLPVKVEGIRGKRSKVCYKCAYELKQCSNFVKRYKESRTNVEQKGYRKKCCHLCLEPAKKGYIFKIDKDNDSLNNLWCTVQKLFDGDLPEIRKSPLICLTCRYILDILLDLTCLCKEMSKLKNKFNEDIDYSAIPKVNTAIIKRKTTAISFMRSKTHVLDDSDSDSSISQNQSTAEMNKDTSLKLRSCDRCKNSIRHGEDMFRYYRTGLTVCGTCRGSMDLSRQSKMKSKQSTSNTKLCTVFLKDVLTDTSLKKQKSYKVEKDSYGNQVYIITESESEVELEDKVKDPKESEKIQEKYQTRSTLKTKSGSSDNETKAKKKIKVVKKETLTLSKLRELPLRSSTRKTATNCNHHSDTDILLTKSQQNNANRGVKRRNTSISSVSDVDTDRKSGRKKLKAILEHFRPLKDSDISDDTSIIENSSKEKNTTQNEKKRKSRSSSVSSTNESECSLKTKYSKRTNLSKNFTKVSNSPEKESVSDRTDVDKNLDENEKYICTKCSAIHENKLTAATHELTHFKQLELKLHKINIPDKLEDEQQVDGSSERQLIDELAEQQNEEITLTVNDDEDIDIAGTTEDTNKQPDKEIYLSVSVNQEEDSLKMDVSNKESIEGTEVIDTITEPVHEESKTKNELEVKTCVTTVQNLLIPTSTKNESVCFDGIKNDQIQNSSFESNKIENDQKKINKVVIDEDKMLENENIESMENEKVELNLEVIDEDESKENEIAGDTENETTKLQENNTEEIRDDKTNKAEKDKSEGNDSKIEETEKDKNEAIENITQGQKEQDSDKSVGDDPENFSAGNAKLNDIINTDEVQSDNSSQEKQKIIENDDNDNDKKETNINIVDSITSEDCVENGVSTCNVQSTIDTCHSTEGETEQVKETSTSDAKTESKCTGDKSLPNSLEDTNSSKSPTDKQIGEKENVDQESTNKAKEMVENMFDVSTDELNNHQNITDQNKRYNEMEAETLEDISREIQKSADMPSLEPISSMEVDHKELV